MISSPSLKIIDLGTNYALEESSHATVCILIIVFLSFAHFIIPWNDSCSACKSPSIVVDKDLIYTSET